MTMSNVALKYPKNKDADERQANLYKNFSPDSFLGNPRNVDHTMQWVTFFRRNLHRFAIDYLGLRLHLYQILMLYLMGINHFIVVIASRASAKSFIIAVYACCRCILYPGTEIVLAAATRGQSKLIVSEKIEKELMNKYSVPLRKEIRTIKNNQNEIIVFFKNNSSITVVTASDNSRGYRSNVLIREEFRMISKSVEDSVLSPFQVVRHTPYMTDKFYEGNKELEEDSVNIYISSSWLDNGHWMWEIVDQAKDDMITGEKSCLLAFDESIALRHGIKKQRELQREQKKQDPLTWRIEFLNERVRENEHAFFTYSMLQQNQKVKQIFYPRSTYDFKAGKKNPYEIPKQRNEVRIVSCDMAFMGGNANDNSVFSCMRLLPECVTYTQEARENIKVDNGYKRVVSYMEHVNGGDVTKQARRIRQLYEDFGADYIVLDTRNAGLAVYDMLANIMYDEERGIEYSPLCAMNKDELRDRINIEGANPCIFAINASQNLNSEIAKEFKLVLISNKIDLPISLEKAREETLANIKEYTDTPDGEVQAFYEAPYLETQALISETAALVYEKKEQTGVIVVRETAGNRKDRYTSVSYGSYFAGKLEKDMLANSEEYAFATFIN